MKLSYETVGTCSKKIDFDIVDGKLRNVSFERGCNGNLRGMSTLVEGMDAHEAVRRLKGITCGERATSCPDQLAVAIERALEQQEA